MKKGRGSSFPYYAILRELLKIETYRSIASFERPFCPKIKNAVVVVAASSDFK